MNLLETVDQSIPIPEQQNSLTLEAINGAINSVENAHKMSLDNIRHFVIQNQSVIIHEFNEMKTFESIDHKFRCIEKVFSDLPGYQDFMYYILEIAVLLR